MKIVTALMVLLTCGLLGCSAANATSPPASPSASPASEIQIDVPVKLESAKVFFNLDRLAFAGDVPVGVKHMAIVSERLTKMGADWHMIGVFHGPLAYVVLNDEKYNAVRKTDTGNPYKRILDVLLERGVQLEQCSMTMRFHGWTNKDLLPGVKVTTGSDLRMIELTQKGYTMIQP